MASLIGTWDQTNERKYETGVDRGVLYTYNAAQRKYNEGVAWNGLTGVTETPSGAEETKLWADNMKYLSMRSAEELGGGLSSSLAGFKRNSSRLILIGALPGSL